MENEEHIKEHAVQQELNRQFSVFLENHWPTLEKAVARVDGKLTILIVGIGALLSVMSTVVVKVVFF